MKEESFLVVCEGMLEMYPDLEVMRGSFNDHTSWFEGATRESVMCREKGIGNVICKQIG